MRPTGFGVWTGIAEIDACYTGNILVTQRNEGGSIHAVTHADEALKAGDLFPLVGRLALRPGPRSEDYSGAR